MKNKFARYSIKFARQINEEILRAKPTLGDKAEEIVYREFQEAVKDYLSEPTVCTEEEFVGFFHKYVGFAITSHSASVQMKAQLMQAQKPMETEVIEPQVPATPWYEDKELIK